MVKYHWVQNAGRSVNWSSASSWAEQKLLKCKMLSRPSSVSCTRKATSDVPGSPALSLQATKGQCNACYKVNRNFAIRTIHVLSHPYMGPYHLPIRINGVYIKIWGRERGKSQEKTEKNALSLCCASGQGTKRIWNNVISKQAIARSRNCNGDETTSAVNSSTSKGNPAEPAKLTWCMVQGPVPVMLCRLLLL